MSHRLTEAVRNAQIDRITYAAMRGQSYRITPDEVVGSDGYPLDDGEEFTVQIVPTEAGGTVHLQTPTINPEEQSVVDVFENAEPDGTEGDTADDLLIHNMRYDSGMGQEVPEATIRRITDGSLNLTPADQTEHRLIRNGQSYEDAPRQIWRTVPVGDNISIRVTDASGGNANELDFAIVVLEGGLLPQ